MMMLYRYTTMIPLGQAKFETQFGEVLWGDSHWVSVEQKFECIYKCWGTGWDDSLHVRSDELHSHNAIRTQFGNQFVIVTSLFAAQLQFGSSNDIWNFWWITSVLGIFAHLRRSSEIGFIFVNKYFILFHPVPS